MASRRLFLLSFAALLAIVLHWVSTPPTIIPPADAAVPATVYVMNQDYHSRLILPTQDGGLVQYAYGDWQYFALYQQTVRTALAALLVPTQGAFGRREYPSLRDLQQATTTLYNGSLLSFTVSSTKAAQLLEALNARFDQNVDTAIVNSLNRMTFVQDSQDYTLVHNSNHEVVAWLEALGCQVEGFVMWAGFRVQEP
jgi:hypothetical protein